MKPIPKLTPEFHTGTERFHIEQHDVLGCPGKEVEGCCNAVILLSPFFPHFLVYTLSTTTLTSMTSDYDAGTHNISAAQLKHYFSQYLLEHATYSLEHTTLLVSFSKSKIFSWFTFQNSEYKHLASKYFCLTFAKSTHTIKICLIVILNGAQAGGSFFQENRMHQIRMTNL